MPRLTKLSKLAKVAVNALEDLKGQDIKVLDVQKLTSVTDTMVICSGTSTRHVSSLAQNVAEEAKKAGHRPMGIEGKDTGEWVLVDLGDVVVHVMQPQARLHYQLEKLWTVEEDPVEPESKPKKVVAKKSAKAPAKKAAKKTAAKKAAPKKAAVKKAAAKKAPATKAVKKVAKKAVKKAAARR